MKLVIAIVSDHDTHIVIDELVKENFHVTRLSTSGGFLKSGNSTLMIGVDANKVEQALKIIEINSKRRVEPTPIVSSSDLAAYTSQFVEVPVGGATVFVLDVEQFKKL